MSLALRGMSFGIDLAFHKLLEISVKPFVVILAIKSWIETVIQIRPGEILRWMSLYLIILWVHGSKPLFLYGQREISLFEILH